MNKATCIYEPRGNHGLEGYQLGAKYGFKRIIGTITGRKLVDIYGLKYEGGFANDPMNTTTERRFMKYFKEIKP